MSHRLEENDRQIIHVVVEEQNRFSDALSVEKRKNIVSRRAAEKILQKLQTRNGRMAGTHLEDVVLSVREHLAENFIAENDRLVPINPRMTKTGS